jgi:uncharacterized OsmC-like protein
MYAERKGWPLEHVEVRLRHAKIHAEDCDACETASGSIDRIEREIALEGPLDDEQRRRLLEIADRCPVHRTLHSEVDVVTRVAPKEEPPTVTAGRAVESPENGTGRSKRP